MSATKRDQTVRTRAGMLDGSVSHASPRVASPPTYESAIASSSTPTFSPVVVPQLLTSSELNTAHASPFQRAHAPALEDFDISEHDFLHFIDGLNDAFMAPAVLQGMHFVGSVVTKVPNFVPQLIGSKVSLVAGLSSASLSYARTKAYIRKANKDTFGPRGLHVRICDSTDMLDNIGANARLFESCSESGSIAMQVRQTVQGDDAYIVLMKALAGHTAPLILKPLSKTQGDKTVVEKMESWQTRQRKIKDSKDARHASNKADRGRHSAADHLTERKQKTIRKTRWIVITRDADAATRGKVTSLACDEAASARFGDDDINSDHDKTSIVL